MYSSLSSGWKKFGHHFFEFLELNASITVDVNFTQNFFPNFLGCINTSTKDLFNFSNINLSTVILVKVIECSLQLFVLQKSIFVDWSSNELWKINFSTMIDVDLSKNAINFLLCSIAIHFRIALKKLIVLQKAVIIRIKFYEYLLKRSLFFFWNHVLHHERKSCLLKFLIRIETA